jgi:hypothetical protein
MIDCKNRFANKEQTRSKEVDAGGNEVVSQRDGTFVPNYCFVLFQRFYFVSFKKNLWIDGGLFGLFLKSGSMNFIDSVRLTDVSEIAVVAYNNSTAIPSTVALFCIIQDSSIHRC